MATMVGTQTELVGLLSALIELDYDAIQAYRAAIAKIKDVSDKGELGSFLADHERHVTELSDVVVRMGGTPPRGPDAKQVLTKGKVVIASLMGDHAILAAMKTNEDDTNTAYERASNRSELNDALRALLTRNLNDERRHRAYIERRMAETKGATTTVHR